MSDWNPFWTEEVKIENGGRYPLLLNRFHDHLEEYLIKGIVSITDRLRYISYCCWIIGDIEHTMNIDKYHDFEEAFRRRESALAIGSFFLNPETELGNYVLYGRDYMRGRFEDINESYNTSFSVLPSNSLGAYGQYYKGTLQNWGITYIDDKGIIRLTDTGNELYRIMNRNYQENDYYLNYKGKKYVPGIVLLNWGKINVYDNIRDDLHTEERNYYKRILFHLEQKSTEDYRRDTLTLYLECIKEAEKKNVIFDERFISNIFYYQMYYRTDTEIEEFMPSSFLKDASFYWMIYEIHVYFQMWISVLFRDFLSALKRSQMGLSIDEVIDLIHTDSFNNQVGKFIKIKDNYIDMTYGNFSKCIIQYSKTRVQLLVDRIADDDSINLSENCANILMTFSLLYQRYLNLKDDKRYLKIRLNLSEDYWYKDFFEIVEAINEKKIFEVLKLLLNRFIIQRHDNAMYEKRDLRRCWFTKSGERYIYQADANIEWRSAKHDKICKFLFDMKLIDVKDNTFVVSKEGNELYKELKENYYEE
jgi:hypothetical protein